LDFLTILRQKERGVSEGTLVILPLASLSFRAEYSPDQTLSANVKTEGLSI
jgi:hypothetical protein